MNLHPIYKNLLADTLKNKIHEHSLHELFRERRFIKSIMIENLKLNLNSQCKSKPLDNCFQF